jgi:hypothetical protein
MRPLPSTLFPIHYPLVTLSFDVYNVMYWVVTWALNILSTWKEVISYSVTMTHAAVFCRRRKRRIWIIARNKKEKIAPQYSNVPALSHSATSSHLEWNYPNRLRSGIAGLVIARCLIRNSPGLSAGLALSYSAPPTIEKAITPIRPTPSNSIQEFN